MVAHPGGGVELEDEHTVFITTFDDPPSLRTTVAHPGGRVGTEDELEKEGHIVFTEIGVVRIVST